MKKLHTEEDLLEMLEQSLRPSWRIGIIYSTFYSEEMKIMTDNAVKKLCAIGMKKEHISMHPVSGSFEIPLIGAALAKKKAVHALIGLGIIVEGETHHARLVAENTARGMMDIQVAHTIPFVNEVLYVDNLEMARGRLSKGEDAALCALHSLAALGSLQS